MIQNDISDKDVINYMAKEKGMLLAEIDHLKYTIERKDEAIKAFKKWQSKVAQRKWDYWLSYGMELMETPPDKELNKKLSYLLRSEIQYKRMATHAMAAYDRFEDAKQQMKEIVKEEQK